MRTRPVIVSIGFVVASTLLAARSARALQPAEPAPAQPSSTAPAETATATGTATVSPPATTATSSTPPSATGDASGSSSPSSSAPASPAAMEGATPPPSNGFHVAAGIGPSGSDRPGVGAQVRVGWRFTPKWRVFLHSLHHLYPVSSSIPTMVQGRRAEIQRVDWRDSFITGPGVDYFFLPTVAARASVGLGCDCLASGKGDSHFGYSFLLGMSFDVLGDRDIRGTVDPYIHKLQIDTGGATGWTSATVIGATLNFSLR